MSNFIYDPALVSKEISESITHLLSKTMLIILLGRRDAFRVYALPTPIGQTHRLPSEHLQQLVSR